MTYESNLHLLFFMLGLIAGAAIGYALADVEKFPVDLKVRDQYLEVR